MIRMMKIDRSRLTAAAMGALPCALSIENARLVNVFTGEIYPASIDVLDGVVVRVRAQDEPSMLAAERVVDAEGMYLLPGFIDTHMHVESSLLVPENFGKAAVTWGTTTVFTDPHEIANVLGAEGVMYMLENAKRSPLRQFTLIPSCVPSLPGFETSGAEFTAEDIENLLDQDNTCGIAEIMDFFGVIHDEPRMRHIVAAGDRRGVFLQGHAPGLSGKDLCAYLAGGPMSDHESETSKEILEKRRLGMYVDVRIHSREEAQELLEGMERGLFRDSVSLCTDDVNAYRLQRKGHINRSVADLIEAGMQAVEAVRLATLNAAREYGIRGLGAIAPGYAADMQLARSLDFVEKPVAVFVGGKQVAQDGVCLAGGEKRAFYDKGNTVRIAGLENADCFRIPAQGKPQLRVMVVSEGYAEKTIVRETLPARGGFAVIPERERGSLNYICVLNRYGKPNKTITLSRKFGLRQGAIASSVSHDSHNLFLVYADAEDAYAAAKALQECGGGVCYVRGGAVRALLPLPVAGLMSDLPLDETAAKCAQVERTIGRECGKADFSLSDLIFETLPVIARYTPTDLGVVDGAAKQWRKIIE